MKIVYMTGVFDILHKGHLRALRRAKYLGDFLVVGIQDDAGALEDKHKKPHLTTRERVEQMQELPFVDKVVVYNHTTAQTIAHVGPHIFVHSPEWLHIDRTEVVKYLQDQGIVMIELPYTTDISTSEIEKRIYDTYKI